MRPRRLALWAPLVLALASGPGARADASKKPEDAAAPPAEIKTNSGPQTSAGGRITVEKPTVDAGDVVRGKPAMAVFEIKNTGTGILKIISAKPG